MLEDEKRKLLRPWNKAQAEIKMHTGLGWL